MAHSLFRSEDSDQKNMDHLLNLLKSFYPDKDISAKLQNYYDHFSPQLASYERAAFFIACEFGNASVIKTLKEEFGLTREDAIIKANAGGFTPLHFACEFGHTEVIKTLKKEFGLTREDALIKATNGHTSLHIACEFGHAEVIKTLKEKFNLTREDALAKINLGHTPLHIASETGHTEVIKTLKEEFSLTREDALIKTNRGSTPLHIACENGHAEAIKSLKDEFSLTREDVLIKATNGHTPLHIACGFGCAEVIKTLKEEFDLTFKDILENVSDKLKIFSIWPHLQIEDEESKERNKWICEYEISHSELLNNCGIVPVPENHFIEQYWRPAIASIFKYKNEYLRALTIDLESQSKTTIFVDEKCSICLEVNFKLKNSKKRLQKQTYAITACGHIFHQLCYDEYFAQTLDEGSRCPLCRQNAMASGTAPILNIRTDGDESPEEFFLRLAMHNYLRTQN